MTYPDGMIAWIDGLSAADFDVLERAVWQRRQRETVARAATLPEVLPEELATLRWQAHDTAVKAILKAHGCMDTLGRIRKWTAAGHHALGAAGHTSLDFDKCECRKD